MNTIEISRRAILVAGLSVALSGCGAEREIDKPVDLAEFRKQLDILGEDAFKLRNRAQRKAGPGNILIQSGDLLALVFEVSGGSLVIGDTPHSILAPKVSNSYPDTADPTNFYRHLQFEQRRMTDGVEEKIIVTVDFDQEENNRAAGVFVETSFYNNPSSLSLLSPKPDTYDSSFLKLDDSKTIGTLRRDYNGEQTVEKQTGATGDKILMKSDLTLMANTVHKALRQLQI